MAPADSQAGSPRRSGFWEPLRSVLATLTDAWHTRLELFATEIQEELERLKRTIVLTLVLFHCATLGTILLTIFLVALLWEAGWIYAVGGIAFICLAVALTVALVLRKKSVARPGLLSATLAELARDRDQLRSLRRE